VNVEDLVFKIAGDPDYIRFLLVERPYIRSALLARGQIYDQEQRNESYSSVIGNNLHNDIIELEQWLDTLRPSDRRMLEEWAERAEGKPYFGRAYMRRVHALVNKYAEDRDEQQERSEGHGPQVALHQVQAGTGKTP
jgi:hypothetical protein